jgi:hypothetical protein
VIICLFHPTSLKLFYEFYFLNTANEWQCAQRKEPPTTVKNNNVLTMQNSFDDYTFMHGSYTKETKAEQQRKKEKSLELERLSNKEAIAVITGSFQREIRNRRVIVCCVTFIACVFLAFVITFIASTTPSHYHSPESNATWNDTMPEMTTNSSLL